LIIGGIVNNKGIARETIFLVILGIVTVTIILAVLWPLIFPWTPECTTKKYNYCVEYAQQGFSSSFPSWRTYAPECPSITLRELECRSMLLMTTTTTTA